jgi:hypothetical protein
MTIKPSKPFLLFLAILAFVFVVCAFFGKSIIFGILAIFIFFHIFLSLFRKIVFSERSAVYYAIFTQRNIRYIGSIDCTGFGILNVVKINGESFAEIKIYNVENFNSVKKFSQRF